MKSSDKFIFRAAVVAIAASIVMAVGCKRHSGESSGEEPEVDVAVAFSDSVIIHKDFPGVLQSSKSVEVVAQANGRIVRKCFNDGDYVNKGDVLYEIDAKTYQSDVAEAQAAIAQAQGQYDYYATQSAAMNRALQADAVAEITVEQAESNLRTAKASLDAAKAKLAAANTALSYCHVTAPISGNTMEAVQEGEYASAGRTLVSVVDNSKLKVTFSIDEAHYQQLAAEGLIDQKVSSMFRNVPVKFEGAGVFNADLFFVSPAVDVNTGSVTLEGNIDDPQHILRDGMYATVSLPMSVDKDAVLVNDASVGTDLQGKYIYLVNDSNRVVYTPVTLGETICDTLRIVDSGVKAGDRYVLSAILTVRNGEMIKPVVKDIKK